MMLKWESAWQVNIVHRGDVGLPVMKRAIDCTKAKEVLKFQAKTSIKHGLRRTMAWRRGVMTPESSTTGGSGLSREGESCMTLVIGHKVRY